MLLICTCSVGCLHTVNNKEMLAYQCSGDSIELDYPLSYESVWEATNTALINLNMGLSSSYKEDYWGVIDARHNNGRRVLIALRKGPGGTSIAIKDEVVDDCALSERIHDEIISVLDM